MLKSIPPSKRQFPISQISTEARQVLPSARLCTQVTSCWGQSTQVIVLEEKNWFLVSLQVLQHCLRSWVLWCLKMLGSDPAINVSLLAWIRSRFHANLGCRDHSTFLSLLDQPGLIHLHVGWVESSGGVRPVYAGLHWGGKLQRKGLGWEPRGSLVLQDWGRFLKRSAAGQYSLVPWAGLWRGRNLKKIS